MIGTILHDRWRIVSELGRGGMGEVYLAEHLALGRKEALKILMPSVAAEPQFVSRFRREARAVNRLRHPNIVAVYDFGQLPDQRFYLAMEYVPGESVFHLLHREQTLPVPRALHLLGQLAYAVHHAHSRGVMHRDLKPGNLIVVTAADGDEHLKVLDFGMAKIVAPDFAESAPLSVGNVIWGTARYMAPERAAGTGDDPRTDLYAIGCIGYELLVGAAPFTGKPEDIIHAHFTQEPTPPSARRPTASIPAELDEVILRCLEKKPADRFQTAAELFAALRKVPSFPVPRGEARRRFVPVERAPDTLPMPRAPTDPGNARGTLREVAEALLDAGLDDARLVSGIAKLRDHEGALERLEAAQDALEHEAAAVRTTAVDREASLRFALGELQFAAAQAQRPADADRIRELETRLAAATADGDRARVLEQSLASVAALRETGLDTLKGVYAALQRVVDELLPHVDDPERDSLTQRLAMLRSRRDHG